MPESDKIKDNLDTLNNKNSSFEAKGKAADKIETKADKFEAQSAANFESTMNNLDSTLKNAFSMPSSSADEKQVNSLLDEVGAELYGTSSGELNTVVPKKTQNAVSDAKEHQAFEAKFAEIFGPTPTDEELQQQYTKFKETMGAEPEVKQSPQSNLKSQLRGLRENRTDNMAAEEREIVQGYTELAALEEKEKAVMAANKTQDKIIAANDFARLEQKHEELKTAHAEMDKTMVQNENPQVAASVAVTETKQNSNPPPSNDPPKKTPDIQTEAELKTTAVEKQKTQYRGGMIGNVHRVKEALEITQQAAFMLSKPEHVKKHSSWNILEMIKSIFMTIISGIYKLPDLQIKAIRQSSEASNTQAHSTNLDYSKYKRPTYSPIFNKETTTKSSEDDEEEVIEIKSGKTGPSM